MPAPVPAVTALVERYVSAIEAVPLTATDGSAVYLDAHSANSLDAVRARVSAELIFEAYLRLAILAAELMPDTAIDYLVRQGSIWRTPQLPATNSAGGVIVIGSAGLELVAGTEFYAASVPGVRWKVVASATAAAGATEVSVAVQSETPGANTVLAAGTALSQVSPNPQITSVVVDGNGLYGGTDAEAIASWRARILANIRSPAAGGDAADYTRWAIEGGAAYVNVVPGWTGIGTVGVIVAMAGPSVPTPTELANIQSYIDAVRPVRGNVTVVAAALTPVPVQLGLNPDNTQQRALVSAAVNAFFVSAAQVGGTLYQSQLSAEIAAIGGETSFLIYEPAGDTVLANNQLAVLGTIAWGAAG